MMFEQHTALFSLLTSLERMRMEQKLTNQELGLFVNGVDTSEIEDNIVFDDKPTWLTNKVWLDCAALETTLEPFKGLRESFKKYSLQWQEYFKCPVVLMNSLPGERLAALSVFQKCLLWRICAAPRMMSVSDALILYELGGVISGPTSFNVAAIYERSEKNVPVVCILPAAHERPEEHNSIKAHPSVNPAYEILQFAKEIKMEGKVHVVTCGVPTQTKEIHHALEDCMTAGYWLVIQNAHLSEPWPKHMLDTLKEILSARVASVDEEDVDDGATEMTDAPSAYSKMSNYSDNIHKDFRLWVITRSDDGRPIPGLLIQYGIKVTCENTHSFQDTLSQSYKTANKIYSRRDRGAAVIKQVYGPVDCATQIALLHALLQHRRNYGMSAFARENYWTYVDLNSIIEQIRVIITLTQRTKGLAQICELIFGGHCADTQDRMTVQALCDAIMIPPKHTTELPESTVGVTRLIRQLVAQKGSGGRTQFSDLLSELTEVDAETVNLPLTADKEHTSFRSRNLLSDLVRVVGAPDLLIPSVQVTNRKAELYLLEAGAVLEAMPDPPDTDPHSFYPMDMFYHAEVQIFIDTIELLQGDVTLLLAAARGEVASTPELLGLLQDVSEKRVPVAWQRQSYPSCVPLVKWTHQLKERLELLTGYIEHRESGVPVYNMAVFHRPDRFIQCVLQTFARKEFKEVHTAKLDVQFLPMNKMPEAAPKSGVYVSGLWLNHAAWHSGRSTLRDCEAGHERGNPLPVIWLRPLSQGEYVKARAEVKHKSYDCPILFSPGTRCLRWTNIIASLDLPTEVKPGYWGEKRVYMTCALNKTH